jgi:hypothetical protein
VRQVCEVVSFVHTTNTALLQTADRAPPVAQFLRACLPHIFLTTPCILSAMLRPGPANSAPSPRQGRHSPLSLRGPSLLLTLCRPLVAVLAPASPHSWFSDPVLVSSDKCSNPLRPGWPGQSRTGLDLMGDGHVISY